MLALVAPPALPKVLGSIPREPTALHLRLRRVLPHPPHPLTLLSQGWRRGAAGVGHCKQLAPEFLKAAKATAGAEAAQDDRDPIGHCLRAQPSLWNHPLRHSPNSGVVASPGCLLWHEHESSHQPQSGSPMQSSQVFSPVQVDPPQVSKLHIEQGSPTRPCLGPNASPA